jgi:hypothetical protein
LSHFISEVTPVSVLVLLDSSSSIKPSLDAVKAAAARFVRALGPGDQARIGFFKDQVRFGHPFTDNSLNRSYYQIREELHGQYQMAYVPKNTDWDGAWRDIVVRIKGLDHLVVRTRQGYYALPRGESATTVSRSGCFSTTR